MNIPVIFEDENILVLNKPFGVVVHPFDFSEEYTLLDFVATYCPSVLLIKNEMRLQDGRNINLGGVVHKLDRDTSGVLVLAKNNDTFVELQKQFRKHVTEKVYMAIVEGVLEHDTFVIDAPLGRSKKDYKQSTCPERVRGVMRAAVTQVRMVKRNVDGTTLVKLIPKTGRTHQLRAHMASVGHPIVGDRAYGSKMDSERILLHAKSLSFTLFGKEYFFEVESNDFE